MPAHGTLAAAFDVDRARAETPGCEALHHFDNAGAALQPAPVRSAVFAHLEREQMMGGYAAEEAAEPDLERLYASAARLIGARPDEIACVDSATRAWCLAAYALRWRAGEVVVTSASEYASNYLAFLQLRQRFGVEIRHAPLDVFGRVDVERLPEVMDERVRLVAVNHVPSQCGLVNSAEAIGAVAKQFGAAFLLDACQSAGQLPLDVEAAGCDFLSLTSRKFLRGPRGAGLLYVRRSRLAELDPPFIDLHAARWTSAGAFEWRDDARRFETWEGSVAAKLGLVAAIDYALEWGLPAIATRVQSLARRLRAGLCDVAEVEVRDVGPQASAIVVFRHRRVEAESVRRALANAGFTTTVISTGTARLDAEAHGWSPVVRASPHYFNTEDEVDAFSAAVSRLP